MSKDQIAPIPNEDDNLAPVAQPAPTMITEEVLQNRLAQKDRIHQKQLQEMEAKMEAMSQRGEPAMNVNAPQVAQQAATNVLQANQNINPPSLNDEDVIRFAQKLREADRQAEEQKKAEEQQSIMNNRTQQELTKFADGIDKAVKEDPEFKSLLDQKAASIPEAAISELLGHQDAPAILKHVMTNEDLLKQINDSDPYALKSVIDKAKEAVAYNKYASSQNGAPTMNRLNGERVTASGADKNTRKARMERAKRIGKY